VRRLARSATILLSPAATEQLGHYLFVGERTGPASGHPLIMLLQHGVTLPLWNSLTTTGIIEGRGRMLTGITAPDFQALVEEDISETATAHLNRGIVLAALGRSHMREATPPMPTQAVDSVKSDVAEIKERAHR